MHKHQWLQDCHALCASSKLIHGPVTNLGSDLQNRYKMLKKNWPFYKIKLFKWSFWLTPNTWEILPQSLIFSAISWYLNYK